MTQQTTILMTGGGGIGMAEIYRRFRQRYRIFFADADISAISPLIDDTCKRSIPLASHPDFTEALAALCDELAVDLLVPCVDEELMQAYHIASLTERTRLFLPQASFTETVMHKKHLIDLLKNAGLAVPQTYFADDKNNLSTMHFPAIIKPVHGRGSRHVYKIMRAEQIASYLDLFDFKPEEVIIQEFIPGDEYTVFVSADSQGALHSVVPVKVGLKKGVTLRAHISDDQDVIAYCQDIHDSFSPSSVYNVQLMKTPEGNILPFEINPRISTTFVLPTFEGYDPFDVFLNGRKGNLFFPERKAGLRRYWQNDIYFS